MLNPKVFYHIFTSWLLFACFLNPINAKIIEFETARQKSAGGAGVGSLLLSESSVLNPAPLAFFNESAFLYQQTGIEETTVNSEFESKDKAIILTDATGSFKGALSYIEQNQFYNKRKRISFSLANPINKQSAIGLTYKKTDESLREQRKKEYDQFNFGYTHIFSEKFSLGILVEDVFRKRKDETRSIIGFQYKAQSYINFLLDIGSDYQNLSEEFLYRAAAQFRIYNRFFVRFGVFKDNGRMEDGSGVGLSWAGPKLSFDLAMKNYVSGLVQSSNDINEVSGSLTMKF